MAEWGTFTSVSLQCTLLFSNNLLVLLSQGVLVNRTRKISGELLGSMQSRTEECFQKCFNLLSIHQNALINFTWVQRAKNQTFCEWVNTRSAALLDFLLTTQESFCPWCSACQDTLYQLMYAGVWSTKLRLEGVSSATGPWWWAWSLKSLTPSIGYSGNNASVRGLVPCLQGSMMNLNS